MFVTLMFLLSAIQPETIQNEGVSRIRYNLEHWNSPIEVHIYPPVGCVVLFNRAYDDSWASDGKGQGGLGAYYQYLEWGGTDHRKVIISNILETDEPVNLFFLFGDKVLELVIHQIDALEKADRQISIELLGGQPQIEKPKKEVLAPQVDNGAGEAVDLFLELLSGTGNRRKRTAYGEVVYNFDTSPFFLYLNPKEDTPDILVTEVIKGIKPFGQKHFRFEYPVQPDRDHRSGTRRLLVFPNLALGEGEKLYLRIQVRGERNATTLRLKKNRKAR